MKSPNLKMCQSLPVSDHGSPGKKRVPMTDEEKMRQRNRLLKTPASVKEHASSLAARWITDQLAAYGFDPFDGPFSEKEMKGDAIWIICTECYRAIFDGKWRWPENRKLSTWPVGNGERHDGPRLRNCRRYRGRQSPLLALPEVFARVQMLRLDGQRPRFERTRSAAHREAVAEVFGAILNTSHRDPILGLPCPLVGSLF